MRNERGRRLWLGLLILGGLAQAVWGAYATLDDALERAGQVAMEGHTPQARAILEEAQSLAKDDAGRAHVTLMIGDCLLRESRYDEAAAAYGEVAASNELPLDTRVYLAERLALVQQAKGQHDAARAELQKILALPGLRLRQKAMAHLEIANTYAAERKLIEARAEYRKVTDNPEVTDQDEIGACCGFMIGYLWQQAVWQRVAAIKQLLEQPGLGNGAKIFLYQHMALLAADSENGAEARGWYEKIFMLPAVTDDQKAQAHEMIAKLLAGKKLFDSAIDACRKIDGLKALSPAAAEAGRLVLADILASAGRQDEAVTVLRTVTNAQDSQPDIKQNAYRALGEIYARAGDWPQAIAAYKDGLKVQPGVGLHTLWLHQGLGWMYERQKDYNLACDEWLTIAKLSGNAPRDVFQAYVAAARNAKTAGQVDTARTALEAALALGNVPEQMKAGVRQQLAELQ